MFVPEGMTADEVVAIATEVSRAPARKYLFGYHSVEDLVEQGVLISLDILSKGKFKPRGPKPMALQLKNFLRVWVRNRLSNYRRDNSCRYPNADSPANKSKYNLMHPLKIYSQGLSTSEIFARDINVGREIDDRDLTGRLLTGLSVYERKLYWKKMGGVILSVAEEQLLLTASRRSLGVADNDEE